jgi:RNA chaperone ProQ/FINO-like protein
MTALLRSAALPLLRLKRPPAVDEPSPPGRPEGKAAKPPKPLKAPKEPPPLIHPPEWLPAATVSELRAQLAELLTEVPPVFAGPVVPLALGAREGLVGLARDGCRGRVRRWLRAWCATPAYLAALAGADAQRHDRHGNPVEAVADEHRAFAGFQLKAMRAADRRHGDAPI